MINSSTNFCISSVVTVKDKDISSRYYKAVSEFILSLDYLKTNPQTQTDVNKLLKVLSKFLGANFAIADFIKFDYINLEPEIKKFFGGPGCLKRALDCNDLKKMEFLINKRVNYLMDKLSQALTGPPFAPHYEEDKYKEGFTRCFREIILALYVKGLRNFSSMKLQGLDLSNQTFESCNFYGSSFCYSNLENSNFLKKCDLRWTSFGSANTLYMTVSQDCLTEFVGVRSKLDLIKMDFPKNPKKLRFTVSNNWEEIEEELKFGSNLLNSITKLLQDAPEETLKDDMLKQVYLEILKTNETDKLEIISSRSGLPLFINLQCLILQAPIELTDLCGIRYGNNIQLYSIEALSKRLTLDKKCPLNMSLIYVKKNLFNLIDLRKELCLI